MEAKFAAGRAAFPDVIIARRAQALFLRDRSPFIDRHQAPIPIPGDSPLDCQKFMLAVFDFEGDHRIDDFGVAFLAGKVIIKVFRKGVGQGNAVRRPLHTTARTRE
jgi:hypothetical protein